VLGLVLGMGGMMGMVLLGVGVGLSTGALTLSWVFARVMAMSASVADENHL